MNFYSRYRNPRYRPVDVRSIAAPVGQSLTEDQLRSVVPSIFAVEPHASRSERYTYLPTWDVVQGLIKEGFLPVWATQGRTRDASRREFTKHLIRFRKDGDQAKDRLGKEFKEVTMQNSHDGTSKFILGLGVLKLACLNGLMVGDIVEQLRVGHRGNIVDEVVEGTFEIVENFGKVDASMETMKAISLDRDETRLLGETALQIRFPDREVAPITADQINAPRRHDDTGSDLWTAFNRIQENSIRGGVSARVQNPDTGRWGRRTTREIQGVDQLVGVNRALWTMAERFAELKRGSASAS